MTTTSDILNQTEAAALLGELLRRPPVSRVCLWKMRRRGLPSVRISGRVEFRESSIRRWVEEQRRGA